MPKPTATPKPPKEIEVIARALLVSRGHVLLCFNAPIAATRAARPPRGVYAYLPGGHVDPDESAADALARELLEEAAFPIRVGPLALVSEHTFTTAKGKRHHEVNLMFHVEHAPPLTSTPTPPAATAASRRRAATDLPPVASLEPDIALHWVPLDALANLDLRPAAVRDWLIARAAARASGADHLVDLA
jgi:8-oxo-dGTP diphosphatase